MSYTSRVAEYMDFDGLSEQDAIARVCAEREAAEREAVAAIEQAREQSPECSDEEAA